MEENKYIFTQLEDNSYVGLTIYEVKQIPDITILIPTDENEQDYSLANKKEFESLLTEIYYNCKNNFNYDFTNQDYAIELAFLTEPTINQTYKANIKPYILLRAIGPTKDYVSSQLKEMAEIFSLTLQYNKYDIVEVANKEEIRDKMISLAQKDKRVITKDFGKANLQSNYLPECFSFAKLPEKIGNFSRIYSTLTNYPNSLFIIDLIPTILNRNEINSLEVMSNALEMLKKGISSAEGNITNALAEKHAENYQYYEKNKNGILYSYNIMICSDSHSITNISSKIISEIGVGTNQNNAELLSLDIYNDDIDIKEYFNSLPWAINEITYDFVTEEKNMPEEPCLRMPFLVTAEEASEFFRIPYGDKMFAAGIKINRANKNEKQYMKKIINTGDIMIGTLKSSNNEDKIGINLDDITKHLLVVGMPGSGKTTFSIGLLDQLWKDHHIPFLVIEPAKNEYRAMIDSIPEIQVFTPGKDFISPYIINPFIPPKNVRLQSYKTVLKTAFSACVSMTTPLDKIFEDTIDECYSRAGWLPYYTIEDGGAIFTMEDFLKTFMEVFEKIGYKGDASNIGKAGYVRLKGLLKLFQTYNTIPVEDLLTKPTIIELAAIENAEQKSLIIALLLLNIQSYINANAIGTGELKNVLLLEEAHVLLGQSSQVSDDKANPSAVAKGLLTRMLAEVRALGMGIIIADQSPEKVTSDVIRLTNNKLSFNLVEFRDREIIKNSTKMSDVQMDRLPILRPGEAFFYTNGLEESEEIITEDYRKKVQIRTTISDNEIAEKSTYWNNKKDKLKPFIECRCMECCKECNYKVKAAAEEYARRIYAKSFNEQSSDPSLLTNTYKTINSQIKEYDAKATKQLACCTKLQFLRKIKYNTKIKITDKQIIQTLKNNFKKEA